MEFDPQKDLANISKHGISLAMAKHLRVVVSIVDHRFEEQRFRAYGYLNGRPYCLAYTLRGNNLRAISLRRARQFEMDAQVP